MDIRLCSPFQFLHLRIWNWVSEALVYPYWIWGVEKQGFLGLLYLGSVHHKAEKSAKKEKNKGDKPGEVEWEHLTVQGNGESNQFLIPCFLFPFFFFTRIRCISCPMGWIKYPFIFLVNAIICLEVEKDSVSQIKKNNN